MITGGPCRHCGTTMTPQWRRIHGSGVLCNACGIHWGRHGTLDPRKKVCELALGSTVQIAWTAKAVLQLLHARSKYTDYMQGAD